MNILLKFVILYFNNFILLRPENLYVILARYNEIPEDDIINVETYWSMLWAEKELEDWEVAERRRRWKKKIQGRYNELPCFDLNTVGAYNSPRNNK